MKGDKLIEYAVYVATGAAIIWSAWRIANAVKDYRGKPAPTAQAAMLPVGQPRPIGQQQRNATSMIINASIRPLKLATVGKSPPEWMRKAGEDVIDWARGLM